MINFIKLKINAISIMTFNDCVATYRVNKSFDRLHNQNRKFLEITYL